MRTMKYQKRQPKPRGEATNHYHQRPPTWGVRGWGEWSSSKTSPEGSVIRMPHVPIGSWDGRSLVSTPFQCNDPSIVWWGIWPEGVLSQIQSSDWVKQRRPSGEGKSTCYGFQGLDAVMVYQPPRWLHSLQEPVAIKIVNKFSIHKARCTNFMLFPWYLARGGDFARILTILKCQISPSTPAKNSKITTQD